MTKIKFGVWGLGRIGVIHCRCFPEEGDMYELVAVCDCAEDRVSKLVDESQCAGYEDAEAFLENPDMELVIIATRSLDHVVHAKQALAAGKYVLLEKPIAVHEENYQELLKVDQEYPGKLFFLHNHRFEPAFLHVKKIVDSGILGDVQEVKLCRHHAFRRRADWQSILACGGGQLSCWGPHIIDHALQLLGAPVKDVWSHLKRINAGGDADDHVKIILTGENDAVVDLEISDSVTIKGDFCTVYGKRGTLVCPDEKVIKLKYIEPDYELPEIVANPGIPLLKNGVGKKEDIPWREETVKVEPDVNMWHYVEIAIARHLYEAIREGVPFPIANADALEVVRITELVKKQNSQFDWKQ